MSPRVFSAARVALMVAALAAAPALAQQAYDVDPEMRIQQLENQLRQLTGQNEELQYRNRQLEDRLRQLGASPAAGSPPVAQPNVAAMPSPIPHSRSPQVQQAPYEPQIAAPAPIIQDPPARCSPTRNTGSAKAFSSARNTATPRKPFSA